MTLKKDLNLLIDLNFNSKKHQLYAVKDAIDKRGQRLLNWNDEGLCVKDVDYNKLNDIVENVQLELKSFIDSKFNFLEANNKGIKLTNKNSRISELLNIIDGDTQLELFYKFEECLFKSNHIDEDTSKWIDAGGKSSFMRFYMKCEEHKLIKRGKRFELIRKLSDIYKIDSVDKSDYGKSRCEEALSKNRNEFKELNTIKSQLSLNS